jgi:hypothetical protein
MEAGLDETEVVTRLRQAGCSMSPEEYEAMEQGAYLPTDLQLLLAALQTALNLSTLAMRTLTKQLGHDILSSTLGPKTARRLWYTTRDPS